MSTFNKIVTDSENRRSFIGGSDARIIMGDDEAALVRLWREKRGEVEPGDLSGNLIVQLGTVTEELNRRWYERNTGHAIKNVQRRIKHPVIKWMAATLDGLVEPGGAVLEAKFMLPWTFSEEAAAEKHMAQLQPNMWVADARAAVLSIITGGGKWVELTLHADPLYQHLLLTAEKKFWRCVMSGEEPRLFGVEPPRARLEALRIVDMSASNSWAEFAAVFRRTRPAYQEHESAKADLKKLVPEDAKEAIGHGLRVVHTTLSPIEARRVLAGTQFEYFAAFAVLGSHLVWLIPTPSFVFSLSLWEARSRRRYCNRLRRTATAVSSIHLLRQRVGSVYLRAQMGRTPCHLYSYR